MPPLPTPKATQIDLATWERRPLFDFFSPFTEPFHGVCLRVDCTEAFRFAKDSHLSVFLTLMHRSLVAAHRVENFRTRIVDGAVWRYATIHGGSAVGRPNGTIGFGDYPYHPELVPFVREASLELDRVKSRTDLERHPRQDLIRFSTLPWFDFTSTSHARNMTVPDSALRITFGKITEAEGRCTMPVSIHVPTPSPTASTSPSSSKIWNAASQTRNPSKPVNPLSHLSVRYK